MKKILLLIPIALGVGSSAWAGACTSATLSVYDATGFTCTIGDLTFSNFNYNDISVTGGALTPSDMGVNVDPITSGFGTETGLEFMSSWLTGPGQSLDSSISFDVSTSDPLGITDLELFVVGGAGGTGAASVAEGSSSPPVNLSTAFSTSFNDNDDKTTFPPADVFSLSLSKDIAVSGGTTGFGHISEVYNLFSQGKTTMTPEPSLLVLCAGVLGLVPVVRRKLVH